MKKNFFTKFALALTCFMGVFAMASCQTTDSSKAYCEGKITLSQPVGQSDRYIAEVLVGVDNPTIYNIKQFRIHYKIVGYVDDAMEQTKNIDSTYDATNIVPHGAAGYYVNKIDISPETMREWGVVKLKEASIPRIDNIGFQNAWETYLPWWIVCFVLLGISTIAFATTIFKKNLSIENATKLFQAHVASSLTTLTLILLICLIPLIFSGWVVTVMLLGTFVAHFIIAFLLCALKSKIGHRNIRNDFHNPQQ